jgi:hypothetical protein
MSVAEVMTESVGRDVAMAVEMEEGAIVDGSNRER